MGYRRRLFIALKVEKLFLNSCIRCGDALMLSQMIQPGADHKEFQIARGCGGVAEQVPLKRSIAEATGSEGLHGLPKVRFP